MVFVITVISLGILQDDVLTVLHTASKKRGEQILLRFHWIRRRPEEYGRLYRFLRRLRFQEQLSLMNGKPVKSMST